MKNIQILISILSFVNDSFFIVQDKSLIVLNSYLCCSYHVIFLLLEQFGLVIEHGKTEFFHFSRLYGSFNPSLLDLTPLGSSILHPKQMWQYLGFIFNRKLTFQQYINFYVNKALLTVKYMKLLGNLLRDLISTQKCLLYRSCILPIALYSF